VKNWSSLFKSSTNSGIYTITPSPDLPGIEQSARVYELGYIYIDLSGILTKDAFLQVVSREMKFPDYFGMNWDAFEDCLTDLSWFSSRGYVLVFDNLEAFAQNAPEEMHIVRSILKSTAEFWKKQETPFYVLVGEDKLGNK
jgi:RNAse (barnase) inhibitor barstar